MALISRRGRRRREGSTPTPSLYPPGESLLEQLPLEILQLVFFKSHNENLVFTSKSLFACLGYKPSEWLFMQFYSHECIQFLETMWLTIVVPHSLLGRRRIHSALRRRGFTISMYTKLTILCGTPPVTNLDTPLHQLGLLPYIPRRWLRPNNESALISIYQSKAIFFLGHPLSELSHYSTIFATLRQGIQLFAHPDVSIEWPLTILDVASSETMLDEYTSEFIEIFKIAVEKPSVPFDFLSSLLEIARTVDSESLDMSISHIVFRSARDDVIRWGLLEGLAPSTETLEMLGRTASDRQI